MAKSHFRPYIPNQTVLFPQRIDEDIAKNDPVRNVNTFVESLDLKNFKSSTRKPVAAGSKRFSTII